MGAFSVLSRCGHDFDGKVLHVYCGKAFPKKQLEKALPALSAAMQTLGIENGTIELHDTQKPHENDDMAAAIAIMGGGEEVTI